MSDRLFSLRLFARVARTKSFSQGGKDLGLSQPSASRIIADLEKEVGASLLTRTTRGVVLTEAGVDYLARIEPILVALDEADHAARGTGELRGVLRVAIATSFAIREVIPRLPSFMHRHPALRINLVMNDLRQDLISESIDVALRLGVLQDTNAVARRLCSSERILVASPTYLAREGMPDSPASLATHSIIAGPAGSMTDAWSFKRDGKAMSIRVETRLSTSVNEGATAAAVAGLGILSTGNIGCRAELASGALVRILADWKMDLADVYAVFPAGRAAKPSARAFVDHLANCLAG
jgi:DNA-binding transcriptional LysR family regulator